MNEHSGDGFLVEHQATLEPSAIARPSAAPEEEDEYRLHRRFDRMGRLVGDHGMARLLKAHVMVVGLGGVGSFAAEALARSGVGRLTLVDHDTVCVTNTNRQLQAMKGQIGRRKADVLAERIALINPQVVVEPHATFFSAETSEALLRPRPDWVVDAIDNVSAKCHLLAHCRSQQLPVVCSTGAAGRIDPTAIAVADLSETCVDPLAHAVRRILRQQHDFPAQGERFGISAVYSTEPPAVPLELTYDAGKGFRCVCPHGGNAMHSCDRRAVIYGTAGFVTGAFGLTCASIVVRGIVAEQPVAATA